MKSITICISCALAMVPFAIAQRGEQARQAKPSDLMTTTLPDQDIVLTIHVSSDLATAIEKDRRDSFTSVVDSSGATVLMPKFPTLADQILSRMTLLYFGPVKRSYPPASSKALDDAAKAAQAKAEAAHAVTPTDIQKK